MVRSRSIVLVTVAVSAIVLLLGGAATYRALSVWAAANAELVQSKDTAIALEQALSVVRDAETGQRGFLLAQRPEYLEPYEEAVTQLDERLTRLAELLREDSAAQTQLAALRAAIAAKTAEMVRTIELERNGSHEAALEVVRTGEGKQTMDTVRTVIEAMEAKEETEIAAQLKAEDRARAATSRTVLSMTALAILLLGVLVYVTRRAGAQVRAGEQRLATTLRSIGDAVIATDDQGVVNLMNPVAERLTGWPADGARGKHLSDVFRIVNEQSRATVESPVAKVLREGKVVGLANHTLLIRRDGVETPIEDSAAPIVESDGPTLGVVLVFRDATSARAAERALREADRRKDEFLAVLAHELRNPLAPIRQAAVIARSAGATESQVRWSHDVIDRQVGHMARLLDDLLDVSRITRGTLEVRRSRIELSSIVDAAIEMARPLIDTRRHALDVDLPAESLTLDADPLRLAQVLGNLLTNAAKYTEPGGNIRLTARRDGEAVAVRIADNGVGLTQESLARIFEMFVQIAPPLERTEGGLGIGLALAKGLVELHGGSIEARSGGVGAGSEFTVRLPLAPPAVGSEAKPAALGPAARTAPGLRIVVADDNRDAAASLAALLALHGHRVEVAHDGADALEALERSRPELALLDVGMPKLNGYEVARRARAEAWGRATKLVAVTGWGQDHDRKRALAAGFDDHWVKPIEPDAALALCDEIARIR